ncbi:hypothetical protein [uncultured Prevotella sp.]|uniref:hypothetical protein n=1 Tax=uncultured Prevotella sp. TaxID=159272 RepID=UPI0025E1E3A5|nr:hypothetical protein [uncultured Prevotella sp.]
MTIITSKKSINQGVKSMAAKAMSWNQVCKAISGIGGYVSISETEKVRPLELMQSLGVHVSKNSYKPKDIFDAWSERMKKDGKVLMAHAVPYEVLVFGVVYPLYDLKDEKYVRVSMQALCPVVSAADKAAKTDVVVNPTNILRGLQQSVFVDDTLAKIAKSEAKCASITSGYVNVSTDKKVEKWVRVEKSKDGIWTLATEEKKASNAKAAAKGASKGGKKNGKKAA